MKSGQRVQNAEMASSLTFINNEVGGPFLVKKKHICTKSICIEHSVLLLTNKRQFPCCKELQ